MQLENIVECCEIQSRGPKMMSFSCANAAQQRHHVAFVAFDGTLEGGIVAGIASRIHVSFGVNQQLARLYVTVLGSVMQSGFFATGTENQKQIPIRQYR
jgi:hypothetical protein